MMGSLQLGEAVLTCISYREPSGNTLIKSHYNPHGAHFQPNLFLWYYIVLYFPV